MRSAFTRAEAWLQAVRYTAAVMSDLPRRNGWTTARLIGDRRPDRTQRLLNRAPAFHYWISPTASQPA